MYSSFAQTKNLQPIEIDGKINTISIIIKHKWYYIAAKNSKNIKKKSLLVIKIPFDSLLRDGIGWQVA